MGLDDDMDLTAHSTTDPTPSTTQRNRNRSTTALIPPHTTSAKSSIWDYQSHKRKKVLSTTKDGMDMQIALLNVSNSGSGAGGDEERETTATTRTPISTHRAVLKGYK